MCTPLLHVQSYDPPPLGPVAIAALLAQKTGLLVPPLPGTSPLPPPAPLPTEPAAAPLPPLPEPTADAPVERANWP